MKTSVPPLLEKDEETDVTMPDLLPVIRSMTTAPRDGTVIILFTDAAFTSTAYKGRWKAGIAWEIPGHVTWYKDCAFIGWLPATVEKITQ